MAWPAWWWRSACSALRLRSTSGLYIFVPNQTLVVGHHHQPLHASRARRIDVNITVPDTINVAVARKANAEDRNSGQAGRSIRRRPCMWTALPATRSCCRCAPGADARVSQRAARHHREGKNTINRAAGERQRSRHRWNWRPIRTPSSPVSKPRPVIERYRIKPVRRWPGVHRRGDNA